MGARLSLVGIAHRYRGASAPDVDVLHGVDLDVPPGDRLAITGPSGCGKSTLLAIAGGLERPDAGSVRIDGRDIAALNEEERTALRGPTIGFIFQQHHLLPQLTALENVLVPAWARREGRRYLPAGRDLLGRLGLAGRADHRPGQLSGGECQRVAVARALLLTPGLILADEPTGSLDRVGAASLADLLASLSEQAGVTLVVVTHAAEVAARIGRCLSLRDGRLA